MGTNPNLSVGQQAPDFTLAGDQETTFSLEAHRGQRIILYFYPKDMTPGCTTQACDFRDNHEQLTQAGYLVVGVSPDDVDRHDKFRQKHDLNFLLLSDTDNEVATTYGVWREKKNYGKTYMGIVRSTFIIDEDGKIEAIQDNVRAKGHVERLVKEFTDQ